MLQFRCATARETGAMGEALVAMRKRMVGVLHSRAGVSMKKAAAGSGPVIIKKYANRRLYNTETSSYITLDHLAAMTREGRDFKVVDAKTDEDITHNVLTQIIMEEESRGT